MKRAPLKWNISCCYFNELQLPATAQAQCLQHDAAWAYLAHFFLFALMQNHAYKRSRPKIALVRLCVPAGWYARTVVKGDCCCLFNKMNQTLTTYLDKVQLLALRFIGIGEKKKISQAYFCYWHCILPKRIFGEKTSLTHSLGCIWAMLSSTFPWWARSQLQCGPISLLEWNLSSYSSRSQQVSTPLALTNTSHKYWKCAAPWQK